MVLGQDPEESTAAPTRVAWTQSRSPSLALLPGLGVGGAQLGVEFVDLGLVALLQLRSLHLERRREAVVVNIESLAEFIDPRFHKDGLDELKALDLVRLADRGEVLEDRLLELRVGADLQEVVGGGEALLLRPDGQVVQLRHHHRDQVRLHAVAVDEDLADELAAAEDVLEVLGSDVLAVGQLEDVLLPVDDRERAVGVPPPDVAGVKPAVLVEAGLAVGLVAVVARKDIEALEAHLAARELVRRQVPHLGHVHQLDFGAGQRRSNRAGHVVAGWGRHGASAVLGEAVPLEDVGLEDHLEEVKQMGGHWGRPSDHDPHAPSEPSFGLIEDEFVPDRAALALAGMLGLLLQGLLEHRFLDEGR
mmetsp:Transcript_17633/g.30374  ORF Transcript_17633/g.30374 Transcript_17633/m.30374 type:complete len:362 (-) Transcript_17633:1029-2114(-)